MSPSLYLWVFLGSGLGGLTRFIVAWAMVNRFGDSFPWGTFLINLTGSFAIGFVGEFADPDGRLFVGQTARHFLMTGILGGYTTYSSFSLQTLNLAREGAWGRAAAYAFGTFVLCFVAVWAGHLAGAWCNATRHP